MSEQKTSGTPLEEVTEIKSDLRKKEPPLINVQVSNPVTYLKSWWKRVLGGEGVDLHFKIKPLTAITITTIVATFGFGVGRFTISPEKPYIQYVPIVSPAPPAVVDVWRSTAFSGVLRFSIVDNRFYLETTASEAITLDVPENVELKGLVGRRIFATGSYSEQARKLVVSDASDLEILPKKVETVPTQEPTIAPAASESGIHVP